MLIFLWPHPSTTTVEGGFTASMPAHDPVVAVFLAVNYSLILQMVTASIRCALQLHLA